MRRVSSFVVAVLTVALAPAAARGSVDVCDYAHAPVTIRELPAWLFLGHGMWSDSDAWSPDGKRIAFLYDGQVRIFDLEAWDAVATLTDPIPGAYGVFWTDDHKIWFQVERPGTELGAGVTQPPDLYVMNEDGSDRQLVSYPPGLPSFPPYEWRTDSTNSTLKPSRDGRHVATFALIRTPTPDHPNGAWGIGVFDVAHDADGSVRLTNWRIVAEEPYEMEMKQWTPDGRMVVGSTRGGPSLNSDSWILDLAGNWTRLTYSRSWDEDADVNAEGTVAFISDRANATPFQQYFLTGLLPHELDWATVLAAIPAILLDVSHEMFVMGVEDGDRGWVRQLTSDYQDKGYASWGPVWSPDGRRLRFNQGPSRMQQDRNALARGDQPFQYRARSLLATFDCGGA